MSAPERTLGTLDATLIGLGAIVGGGILALGGHAIARVGPAALLVFAVNGVVALLTAGAFAELATRFPVGGGAYAYARRIVSVQAAFGVGWVLWFAYIVAGVLYALGFGVFSIALATELLGPRGAGLGLDDARWPAALGLAAIGGYTLLLRRKGASGGQGATWGKLLVFAILIAVGLSRLPGLGVAHTVDSLRGTFSAPLGALVGAMGLTFIALQGFDAIATVADTVKDPGHTLPRAMLGSVALALAFYLPLLLVTVASGAPPGQTIVEVAQAAPDTVLAEAAGTYAGVLGFWAVLVAGVLAMLSALQANLLAASQVARTMADDRTLPRGLGTLHPRFGTPTAALHATALAMAAVLLIVPDLGSAGAAASLIFLITFVVVNAMAWLARRRLPPAPGAFQLPLYPTLHVVAGAACLVLLLSQVLIELDAAGVMVMWLGVGALLYSALFAGRAEAADAFAEARDPGLLLARGRSSLVLVPVANPAQAPSLVELATVVAPPGSGDVLLLTVVREASEAAIDQAQAVLRRALIRSADTGRMPQALTVFGDSPGQLILDIRRQHGCQAIVLGLSELGGERRGSPLDFVIHEARTDVVVLRAPTDYRVSEARRILVPIGGRSAHDELRARLLGALQRTGEREVTFLRVLPPDASEEDEKEARRQLGYIAADEAPGNARVEVVRDADFVGLMEARCAETDLLVLGMLRIGRRGRGFGGVALEIARRTTCGAVFIGRRT
jgi:APA family basic amino acid/polyamine antiporter